MYTRSYFTEDKRLEIPENYNGNAFVEKRDDDTEGAERIRESFSEKAAPDSEEIEETGAKGSFSQFFERLPFKNIFPLKDIGAYFSKRKLLPEKIGIEEVLILALALYMFFSRDGDKECAIMLALLIFIN